MRAAPEVAQPVRPEYGIKDLQSPFKTYIDAAQKRGYQLATITGNPMYQPLTDSTASHFNAAQMLSMVEP